jgi:hypothetical protein
VRGAASHSTTGGIVKWVSAGQARGPAAHLQLASCDVFASQGASRGTTRVESDAAFDPPARARAGPGGWPPSPARTRAEDVRMDAHPARVDECIVKASLRVGDGAEYRPTRTGAVENGHLVGQLENGSGATPGCTGW